MKCIRCGQELNDGMTFCIHCGASQESNTSQTNQGNTYQSQASAPESRGYSQQNQGYAQQNQGYAQQNQGYAQQNQGYAQQNQGYAQQNQGYAQQNQGYAQQNQGYAQQNRGYAQQNQGYAQQNQGYAQQNQGYYQQQDQGNGYNNQPPYGQQNAYNGNSNGLKEQLESESKINGPVDVDFVRAIKRFFAHYADFNGRASKSEYWWAVLFTFLAGLVLSFIPVVGPIAEFAFLVPGLAIAVRRLHDTGKPWYHYLFGLIPFAGFIILIVFFCKDSDGDNQWGAGPAASSNSYPNDYQNNYR